MSTKNIANRFSYEPTTLDEAFRMAEYLSKSELVPKNYQGKPADILVAMQFGSELGIKPLQALQNIASINGKPCVYGDLGRALLQSRGYKIQESDVEEIRRTQMATCTIVSPNGVTTTRTFSVDDAKTAKLWGKTGQNGFPTPWVTYPYRQLAWRAFWFAARDAAADVLKGIAGREEVDDYQMNDLEASKVQMPTRLSESLKKSLENLPDMSGMAVNQPKMPQDERNNQSGVLPQKNDKTSTTEVLGPLNAIPAQVDFTNAKIEAKFKNSVFQYYEIVAQNQIMRTISHHIVELIKKFRDSRAKTKIKYLGKNGYWEITEIEMLGEAASQPPIQAVDADTELSF